MLPEKNVMALRSLLREYGRMEELDGFTPPARGQRLNGLIADMLGCWGISAESDIRSCGEVDVGFEIEGRHFIVEAKWEAPKTDTGPLAKLQKRLRQRLQGTIGVFLSMAGFTPDALADLKDGDPLTVICLTREHLEAMLSGFIPPAELLTQCLTNASRRGVTFAPLADLYGPPPRGNHEPSFVPPHDADALVTEAIPEFQARIIMSGLPVGFGVGQLAPGRLLLTLPEGVMLADLGKHTLTPWLKLPHCVNNPAVASDGWVYVVRRAGVARVRGGEVRCVAGALVGNVSVSPGRDGGAWVFSNGSPFGTPLLTGR